MWQVTFEHDKCKPKRVIFRGCREQCVHVYNALMTMMYSAIPSEIASHITLRLEEQQGEYAVRHEHTSLMSPDHIY